MKEKLNEGTPTLDFADFEAIILAGGKGTRLRSEVSDLPKPLAPVSSRPFITYLLSHLGKSNPTKIHLSIGYMKEKFHELQWDSTVNLVDENESLGTGGAIRNVLKHTRSEHLLVLNGDSFFGADYKKFLNFALAKNADFALCSTLMEDCSRYGTLELNESTLALTSFVEKAPLRNRPINTGVYYFKRSALEDFLPTGKHSLEQDFLESIAIKKLSGFVYLADAFFIDIGIPEDFHKAQELIPIHVPLKQEESR